MSGRQVRRLAGAGVAGVAAAFAVAPFAHADPSNTTSSSSATPSPTATPEQAAAGKVAPNRPHAASPAATTSAPITPSFGLQKIRVGVQIKSGAWVPPGTNTGGTTVGIVETGPDAGIAAAVNGTSCDTVVGSEDPGSTETYCEFRTAPLSAAVRAKIADAGFDVPAAPSLSNDYIAFPGDTVTFTQTTVNANLLIDATPQAIGPCVTNDDPDFPACPSDAVDVTFNDAGLPPTAKNDTSTVVSGHTVDIDVLGNDVTHGAPTSIESVSHPAHGTATVITSAAAAARAAGTSPEIAYHSTAGFVGTDSFTYTISTPNGMSTATVKVTVLAPPPTAVDDSATATSGHAVTIDVLGNDDANGGGALHISSVGTPGHGTAKISDGKVVYTPDASFTGTDTFTYVAATAFGTDTATVTVTVKAAGVLAASGSQDERIADIGVLLLVSGGAVTAVGRRRYRAKHAGFH